MSQKDDFETPSTNDFVDAVEHPIRDDGKSDIESHENPQDGIFQDLAFYVAQEDVRQEVENLIKAHGGTVLRELPSGLSSKEFVVSSSNTADLLTVTAEYIRACCASNVLLKLSGFLVAFEEPGADTQPQNDDMTTTEAPKPLNVGTLADGATTNGQEQPSTSKKLHQPPNSHEHGNVKPAPGGSITGQNDSAENLLQIDVTTSSHQDEAGDTPQNPTTPTDPPVDKSEHALSSTSDEQASQVGVMNSLTQKKPADEVAKQRYVTAHNKANFTSEEDEFILDVVRKNPTRRTTHTLFDEISRFVPTHTGNSIRHRYRVYLAKRLDFVYQVDNQGKLVRDEAGNLIRTTVLPKSLKNKFVADEDYSLAVSIKRQFYRDLYQVDPDTGKSLITEDDGPSEAARKAITMDTTVKRGSEPTLSEYRVGERRGPVPREFFKTYAQMNPSHTENAWRDRFRKFLLTYGIDKYIEYYDHELAQNRVPEAMKNLTNRPKRPGVPTPGNYSGNAKKRKSSEEEQIAQGETPQERQIAFTSASGGAVDPSSSLAMADVDLLDEETLKFISGLRRDLSKIESAGGTAFEYPQEIAESIRNDFTNEEAQFDEIDPDSIPFPPPLATNDLFMPQFFGFESTRAFLDKINDVISRDYEASQAEKLVQDLCEDAGVRKTFSTSILTALSGDLMVFPRYFLCMFSFKANPPLNVPGIWTREDDETLRHGDGQSMKILTDKHGTGRIEMRKRFIASDLV
ncbi:LANO_0H04698g1_1 [Lachancea nothofagi CBS 11611]|uniref:DNA-binding protein RAP1 n=1 Tax=Lachancea nothofagi CBS 11611 TaxID=1266666 RepID=A0A1G4KL65_9SACH|nr:LANO_0H04698g1_1 [Lachancea nothofagi CBS 11611]